jgi:hypothetical protein
VKRVGRRQIAENVNNVANCRKLAVSNFASGLVSVIKIKAIRASNTSVRPVDNFQIELKITAVVSFICFYFGTFDNYRMFAERQLTRALFRVVVIRVKWAD